MQSKTHRGVRHLLASTGVISLVLSVAAPAALADAVESKRGNDKDKGKDVDAEENDEPATDRKMWVCHATSSEENPWEFNLVSVNSVGLEDEKVLAPEQTLFAGYERKAALTEALAADPGLEEQLVAACDAALALVVEGGSGAVQVPGDGSTNPGGGGQGGQNGVGEGIGGGQSGENSGVGEGIGGGQSGNDGVGQDGGGDVVVDTPAPGTGTPVGVEKPAEVEAPVVVEVPVKTPPATPVTPAQPLPAIQPRPVVVISDDAVTKVPALPALPALPASPAVTPRAENEVLGVVTTRTPTPGVGALDPGAHTAASITALAATGADGTKVLAIAGFALLLSGLGLQVSARRRMRAADIRA